MIERHIEKISRRMIELRKRILFSILKPFPNTLPVFVMGCGRSGTTMMVKTFQRDNRLAVFGENDPKTSLNYLLVDEKLEKTIHDCRVPILVTKPILNSFDAQKLLNKYPDSKIIWMVRDYQDMIASSIVKFGHQVPNYMKDLILSGKGNNWLSIGIPSETLEILTQLKRVDSFTHFDWMGLIWWSVNQTLFIDDLIDSDNLLLVQYERMGLQPEQTLKKVYDHIDLPFKNAEYQIYPCHIHWEGKGPTDASECPKDV